jgi:hypothetical protein
MAECLEVLAQLARMLADDALRGADPDAVRSRARDGLPLLTDALVAEIAASDDVLDRDSALEYLDRRLDFLATVLDHDLRGRLRAAVTERLAGW